jgi:Holliday junction resolvase RusA-like endonuclease
MSKPLATWPVSRVDFRVDGVPRPLQRPRFSGGRVYNPSGKELAAFRKASQQRCPFDSPPPGPVAVDLVFVMVRPQSHFRRDGQLVPTAPPTHQATPDVDNLSKLVLDALNDLYYADDRQIHRLTASKRYGGLGELAGTEVAITYGLDRAVAWPVGLVSGRPEANVSE